MRPPLLFLGASVVYAVAVWGGLRFVESRIDFYAAGEQRERERELRLAGVN